MKRLSFNRRLILAAISACLFAAAASFSSARAGEVTISSDDFTSNVNRTLNGRPVETPQTPGDTYNISNSSNSNVYVTAGDLDVAVTGGFAKVAAPLNTSTLVDPYTLSYDLSFNPGAGNSGFTYYGGFGNGTGDGSSFSDYQGALMFNIETDTTGKSFTLYAGNGAFSTTLSTTVSRANTSTPYDLALSITYNPTTHVAEFDVNNVSIGTTTYTGQVGGLWFKGDYVNDVTGYSGLNTSYITVTENIPEPSTYALMLAGAVALGAMARRRGLI